MKLAALALGLLMISGCTSCSGKKYEFTKGPMRLQVNAPRMAQVGQPWQSTILVAGVMPKWPVMFRVTIDNQLVASSSGNLRTRAMTGPRLFFSEQLYRQKRGTLPKGPFDYDEIVPQSVPDVAPQMEDPEITISFEVWSIELDNHGQPKPDKRLAVKDYKVRLGCMRCTD